MDDIIGVLVALAFIIYSVVAEKKKDKGTTDTADFSDLGSIDDFFKQQDQPETSLTHETTSESSGYSMGGEGESAGDKRRRKKKKTKGPRPGKAGLSPEHSAGLDGQVGYECLSALEVQKSYDLMPAREDINYDNLPSLEGVSEAESRRLTPTHVSARQGAGRTPDIRRRSSFRLNFDRNQMIQGIILSEVLPRRTLESVFERIPNFVEPEPPQD